MGLTNGHHPTSTSTAANPLNITICGAGIGGLSAAIFLRQQGHTVTLVEASGFSNELGAAVHLASNANGLLRRMGLIPEEKGAVSCLRMSQLFPNGKEMFSVDLSRDAGRWQHPWQLAHRVSLHSELRRLATCEEGKGKPAVLKLKSRVLDVDPKEGVVTLESGERIQSDVVVGADGVHSKTRPRIPGAEGINTFGSGKSAFRFLIPRQRAFDVPETRKFADQDGHLIMIFGRDRRVVIYPTNDNTLLNFVCIHPTSESQINPEEAGSSDWQNQGNIGKMLEIYKDFEPAILKLLSMADEETLKVWELLDMEQLPTWTHEKLALIGDAAHPFTPHQGQGAGQAIEDAASLAVMLPLGTPLESIPARLKLYEKCRYERATVIQEYSRVAGRDLGSGPPIDTMKFTNYNFGHDEWHHSSQMLRKWEWENKKGLLWRMPTAFGPMPGPRQDFAGRPRDGSNATFKTASIKFKTSRTVLQNLLPTENLKFAAADTTAYATFAVTQLGNLDWLGGRGYNHFGLYVHGIQYQKADGETVVGTYLPVLFENLADPILSGREELGFPKLYAELDLNKADDKWALDAGWMSSKFCHMSLSGLQQSSATDGEAPALSPPLPRDDGLLFHKYVPATGSTGSKERGQADVEYTAFLPGVEDANTVEKKIERTLRASAAEISFDALDWKALPTLHHIVERLQEVPVYSIVDAKIVEGTGVSDVSAVQKLQ
ncbi:FAD/NAD(P)-binding domain-containing protein [Stemphylium lycopersici]|nr:salicylate hydroxylase [Stemphylium lycopersici]RAR07513.1 FAD/NAD(P)-binding domain-containing protein [Stemphylium lycopersici]